MHRNKTRLLLLAGALFVFSLTGARAQGLADTSQLLNRLNQLENQVQTLSRAVYRGDRKAAGALESAAAGADSTTAASFEVRMSQIEEQQRQLTGQMEKVSYDLQQIRDRLDRLQADTDQRLQQVERKAAPAADSGAAPPAGGGAPGPAASDGAAGAAEKLYDTAFGNVKDGRYPQAESLFRDFLKQYPAHPLAPNAQYWLGETYYVRGDYKASAKAFAQGYQDFPKSAKAADSLLKLGLSLARLDKKEDACLSLRQLQKEFRNEGPLQKKAAEEIKRLDCAK